MAVMFHCFGLSCQIERSSHLWKIRVCRLEMFYDRLSPSVFCVATTSVRWAKVTCLLCLLFIYCKEPGQLLDWSFFSLGHVAVLCQGIHLIGPLIPLLFSLGNLFCFLLNLYIFYNIQYILLIFLFEFLMFLLPRHILLIV